MNAAIDYIAVIGEAKIRAQQPGGPRWFMENVLNQPIQKGDEWQEVLYEAVMDVRRKAAGHPTVVNHEGCSRITIRSAHGPGKTQALANLAHLWNFTTYGLIACTAPKLEHLKTRLFSRYRKSLRSAIAPYQESISVYASKVVVYGDEDWGMVGETASDPDNAAGFHDEPQLFMVDEACAKVLDPMFPVIEGALTTPGSVSVEIGNPTRAEGEFYDHHNKNGVKEMYFDMHIGPDHPECGAQYRSKRIDNGWVEDLIRKYSLESPVVQVRCFGNFVEMSERQLIALQWLNDAKERSTETDGSIPYLRITVDVADGGEDETIIMAGLKYLTKTVVLKMFRFSFPATTATDDIKKATKRIFEHYEGDKAGQDDIVVDSIGVGTGVASGLITDGYPVIRYKGGTTDNIDTTAYRNRKVRSYMLFRNEARDGQLVYAEDFCSEQDWDEYTAQCCSIRTTEDEKKEDLETKKMMKARGIKSPDMPDATSMFYADQEPITIDNSPTTSSGVLGVSESSRADF